MARKTKEESQRTRDRILMRPSTCSCQGVANTTMGDIADHAGVSRGAVTAITRTRSMSASP